MSTTTQAEPRRIFTKYRPEFVTLTGCTNAALLLERIRHLFVTAKGRREFYKFDQAGDHPMCNMGDSWGEELCFNTRRLRDARKKIATRVYKGDNKRDLMHVPTQGDLPPVNRIVLYWRDGLNRTMYWLNEELLYRHLAVQDAGIEGAFIALAEQPLLQNGTTVTAQPEQPTLQNSTTDVTDSAQRSGDFGATIDTESPSESSPESAAQSLHQTEPHHHPQPPLVDDDELATCANSAPVQSQVKQDVPEGHQTTEVLLRWIGVDEPFCQQYNHVPPSRVREWMRKALAPNSKIEDVAAFVMSKLKAQAKPPPPISGAPPSPGWASYYVHGDTRDVWRSLKQYNQQQGRTGAHALMVPSDEVSRLQWADDPGGHDAQAEYWRDAHTRRDELEEIPF